MARITPAATTAARVREERNAASSKRRARKPKAHKIVFESMTQEKKRLRTVISFQAQPPPGFTFVPAGKPSLTEKCKEYSRAGSHRVFVVSTSHRTAANLSQHVHRIGYHFATSVVNKACHYLGISLNRRGEVSNRPARLLRRPSPASVSSQEKLDQDARDALTDLFPNIPEVDREEIIARAFEKGSKNVGTSDLPLPRRVQLAVLAHIRHVYTSYDTLLRQGVRHNAMSTGRRDPRGNWLDAREKVKDACYMKLLEWRGDEENGKDTKAEMEEILREVIIISDDEDEDSDDSDSASTEDDDMHGRSSSIEFVASQPVMQELHLNRTDQARENGVFDDAIGDDQPYIHDASAEGGRRYAIQTTADGQQKRQERIDRRGFHRYKALKPPQEKTRSYTGEADHLESTRKRDDNIPLIQRTRPLRPMDTKSSFDTEETHHGYTFGSSFAIPRAAEQGRYRKEIVDSHEALLDPRDHQRTLDGDSRMEPIRTREIYVANSKQTSSGDFQMRSRPLDSHPHHHSVTYHGEGGILLPERKSPSARHFQDIAMPSVEDSQSTTGLSNSRQDIHRRPLAESDKVRYRRIQDLPSATYGMPVDSDPVPLQADVGSAKRRRLAPDLPTAPLQARYAVERGYDAFSPRPQDAIYTEYVRRSPHRERMPPNMVSIPPNHQRLPSAVMDDAHQPRRVVEPHRLEGLREIPRAALYDHDHPELAHHRPRHVLTASSQPLQSHPASSDDDRSRTISFPSQNPLSGDSGFRNLRVVSVLPSDHAFATGGYVQNRRTMPGTQRALARSDFPQDPRPTQYRPVNTVHRARGPDWELTGRERPPLSGLAGAEVPTYLPISSRPPLSRDNSGRSIVMYDSGQPGRDSRSNVLHSHSSRLIRHPNGEPVLSPTTFRPMATSEPGGSSAPQRVGMTHPRRPMEPQFNFDNDPPRPSERQQPVYVLE